MRRYTASGIEFVALDPGDTLPGHRIVVRYHDIDSLLAYEYRHEYRQKSMIVREQLWQDLPKLASRVRGLSDRLRAIGVSTQELVLKGKDHDSVLAATVKFLSVIEAPPERIARQFIVRAVREQVFVPDQAILDAHQNLMQAVGEAIKGHDIDMETIRSITDMISFEARTMKSRETGAKWIAQHLAMLKRGGYLDWFMIDVKPATGALNDRFFKSLRGQSTEFYKRVVSNIMFRLEITVPDPENLRGARFLKVFKPAVVLAPALFRVIRVLQEGDGSRHVPVVLEGDKRTQDATFEAVHDAALAEPLGREILPQEQVGLITPRAQRSRGRLSALELAFLPMQKHQEYEPPEATKLSASVAEKRRQPVIGSGVGHEWQDFERGMRGPGTGAGAGLFAARRYPMSGGNESLKYMANVDVVRRMVYGISREGSRRDVMARPEVELCLAVVQGVLLEVEKLQAIYASGSLPARIVMRQDYSFLARYAAQNVEDMIGFLAEQRS